MEGVAVNTYPDVKDPVPGDLIEAQVLMMPWESDDCRGLTGDVIMKGAYMLVLQAWVVGGQRRVRAFFEGRIVVMSSGVSVWHRNWTIRWHAPRLPSGA